MEHAVVQILWHGTSTRQCPACCKTYSSCGKLNHFREVCQSMPKQRKQTVQKKKPVHGMQHDEEESWHNTDG